MAQTIEILRAGLMVGFVVGIIIVLLGVYSIYYLLAVTKEVGNLYYGYAGIFLILFGSLIISQTYPIFIPLKKTVSNRICPFCGAIVEEDATVCKKCKRQLDE